MAADHSYPSDPTEAALRLFLDWFGGRYARSTKPLDSDSAGEPLRAVRIEVARRWELDCTLLSAVHGDADLAFEAARAAVERRFDLEGQSYALWLPRGAALPQGEPGLSQLVLAANEARSLEDDRLELRQAVRLHLRRTSTEGSVVTVLGGLSALWAQFTNRVPGSFQLNAGDLHRLPASEEEREALVERVVLAAGQPEVDDSCVIPAEDVWTVNRLASDRAYVIGSPVAEGDEASSRLRRTLRKLLREAQSAPAEAADARALIVLAATTELADEKVSWSLRGMDPTLYSGFDLIAVVTDGQVRVVLEPPANVLAWDAPTP